MAKGWIKIHRQSVDNPLYQEKPFDKWHAWLDILLSVSHEHEEFYSKGELVKLEPGQMITSIQILADRWGWSKNKVRRFLRHTNGTGMSTTNGTTDGTTITVENWGKFQDWRHTDGTTDGTTGGTTNGTLTRSKEDKKREGGAKAPSRPRPVFDRSSIVDEWVRHMKEEEAKK